MSDVGAPIEAPPAAVAAAKRPRMLRQYELIDKVRSYDPTADEAILNRAYVYAMRMHGSQKRASGDPYFAHPIEVAGILTDYRLDTATIVTALLHDVIEDTPVTPDDIRHLFGPEITELVEGPMPGRSCSVPAATRCSSSPGAMSCTSSAACW